MRDDESCHFQVIRRVLSRHESTAEQHRHSPRCEVSTLHGGRGGCVQASIILARADRAQSTVAKPWRGEEPGHPLGPAERDDRTYFSDTQPPASFRFLSLRFGFLFTLDTQEMPLSKLGSSLWGRLPRRSTNSVSDFSLFCALCINNRGRSKMGILSE